MEKREIERAEGEMDKSEIKRRGRRGKIERKGRHSKERNIEKTEKRESQ